MMSPRTFGSTEVKIDPDPGVFYRLLVYDLSLIRIILILVETVPVAVRAAVAGVMAWTEEGCVGTRALPVVMAFPVS